MPTNLAGVEDALAGLTDIELHAIIQLAKCRITSERGAAQARFYRGRSPPLRAAQQLAFSDAYAVSGRRTATFRAEAIIRQQAWLGSISAAARQSAANEIAIQRPRQIDYGC